MPALPGGLTTPGLLAVMCLLAAVLGVNVLFVISYWRNTAIGARDRQRAQSSQLDELHRAVSELSAGRPGPHDPHE